MRHRLGQEEDEQHNGHHPRPDRVPEHAGDQIRAQYEHGGGDEDEQPSRSLGVDVTQRSHQQRSRRRVQVVRVDRVVVLGVDRLVAQERQRGAIYRREVVCAVTVHAQDHRALKHHEDCHGPEHHRDDAAYVDTREQDAFGRSRAVDQAVPGSLPVLPADVSGSFLVVSGGRVIDRHCRTVLRQRPRAVPDTTNRCRSR